MTHHTHRAVSSRTVGWTHCVSPRGCSGAAHGCIEVIGRCRCGATRSTEINGLHVRRGPWVEAEQEEGMTPAEALALSRRGGVLVSAYFESPLWALDEMSPSPWDALREAAAEGCSCCRVCGSRVRVVWDGGEAIVE
jgi:hypothetical protein